MFRPFGLQSLLNSATLFGRSTLSGPRSEHAAAPDRGAAAIHSNCSAFAGVARRWCTAVPAQRSSFREPHVRTPTRGRRLCTCTRRRFETALETARAWPRVQPRSTSARSRPPSSMPVRRLAAEDLADRLRRSVGRACRGYASCDRLQAQRARPVDAHGPRVPARPARLEPQRRGEPPSVALSSLCRCSASSARRTCSRPPSSSPSCGSSPTRGHARRSAAITSSSRRIHRCACGTCRSCGRSEWARRRRSGTRFGASYRSRRRRPATRPRCRTIRFDERRCTARHRRRSCRRYRLDHQPSRHRPRPCPHLRLARRPPCSTSSSAHRRRPSRSCCRHEPARDHARRRRPTPPRSSCSRHRTRGGNGSARK